MGLFSGSKKYRQVPGLDVDQRALDRVGKVSSNELQVWFEAALGGAGVAYDSWLADHAPPEEVTLALAALNAIWTEMEKRGTSVSHNALS